MLLIEDDAGMRESLVDLLETSGHTVILANDGREALDRLVGDPALAVDVILLDMMMPALSGQELIPILKSYTRLARIPIIVSSAMDRAKANVPDGAVEAWLRKPYDAETLLSVLEGVSSRAA